MSIKSTHIKIAVRIDCHVDFTSDSSMKELRLKEEAIADVVEAQEGRWGAGGEVEGFQNLLSSKADGE